MNVSAISGMVVFGRFRIPFPDTTYASRERRDPLTAVGSADDRGLEPALIPTLSPTLTPTLKPALKPCADRRSLRCFVTAHVVASIENLCASELTAHVNSGSESVVGSEVLLKHNYPAAVGSMVSVTGRVAKIEDRSITFTVEAKVDDVVIADGELRFVIVERDRFATRRVESIVERALSSILGMPARPSDAGGSFQAMGQKDPQRRADTPQPISTNQQVVSTMAASMVG